MRCKSDLVIEHHKKLRESREVNLYLRLLLALWSGSRADRLQHNRLFKKAFRVWPHDLDAFGHMNNGRYLQIMDVARAEWMVRTGVFGSMRTQGWSAVLGGGVTRFRRSLKLWQRYEVRTRLMCWDERWFYFEHTFVDPDDHAIAVGVSRAALRRTGGWVHTDEIVDQVAPGANSPTAPDYLHQWLSLDDAMFRHAADNEPVDQSLFAEVSP